MSEYSFKKYVAGKLVAYNSLFKYILKRETIEGCQICWHDMRFQIHFSVKDMENIIMKFY